LAAGCFAAAKPPSVRLCLEGSAPGICSFDLLFPLRTSTSGTLAPTFQTYNYFEFFVLEVIVRLCLLSLLVLWFVTLSAPLSVSQANNHGFPQGPGMQQKSGPEDEARQRIEREMAKKANQERQADLKRDTDKLFRLANELKDYVDKTNENMLSVDVVKKAEEIEKLARSVKDKMKGSN
jgi:hypothetical protein